MDVDKNRRLLSRSALNFLFNQSQKVKKISSKKHLVSEKTGASADTASLLGRVWYALGENLQASLLNAAD